MTATRKGVKHEHDSHLEDRLAPEQKYHTRGLYEELEDWRKGNPHIRGFYRMHIRTAQDVIWSLFHLHNETLNIWTHIFGLFMMCYFVYLALTTWLADAEAIDIALFLAYVGGQSCQMLFSAVFHTTSCWSHPVHTFSARLDYLGIAMTIGGSFFQPLYYAFFCRPQLALFYNTIVMSLCTLASYIIWNPALHTAKWQWLRAAVFLVTAIFGALLPMTHALFLQSPGWAFLRVMAINLLEMGVCYIGGAFFYVSRVPERYAPTAFGYIFSVFNSHVIWHVLIILAAWAHYNVQEENYHLFRPNGKLMTCDEFFNATASSSPLFANKAFGFGFF